MPFSRRSNPRLRGCNVPLHKPGQNFPHAIFRKRVSRPMYPPFSDESRRAMQAANQVATRFGCQYIPVEAILLGVLEQPGIEKLCQDLAVAVDVIKADADVALGKTSPVLSISVAKSVIENAIEESRALRHRIVSTHHILLGILRMTETAAAQATIKAGLTEVRLREELAKQFPPETDGPELPPIDYVPAEQIARCQDHPGVQQLQQHIESLQRQIEDSLANQDIQAARKLLNEKVEAWIELKMLVTRLNGE